MKEIAMERQTEDELIDLVGSDAVTDAKADTPTEPDRSRRVIRAHSFLTLSVLVLNVKNLKKAQASASPATQQVTGNEYFTPSELATMSRQWREQALQAIGEYLLPTADVVEDGTIFYPSMTLSKTSVW